MATISAVCAPSSTLGLRRSLFLGPSRPLRPGAAPSGRVRHRSISAAVSRSPSSSSSSSPLGKKPGGTEKDPIRLWNRYVEWLYHDEKLELSLDVSRMGFTDEFVRRMRPRLLRAIANPDEERMVGHCWLTNPELRKTLDDVCKFADGIINTKKNGAPPPVNGFTEILYIGLGGSPLGPQFVAEALALPNPRLKIRFIDNTDPAGIYHQIPHKEDLGSTLVIVISKSGGTPEIRNGLLEVQKAFSDANLEFSRQAVAITKENSLLDKRAREEGWLASFPMFDRVGSRTSEMSAVGILPAALQGINIREMLDGAAQIEKAAQRTKLKENPAALLAMCWYWAFDVVGTKDMVVLPSKDSLLFSWYFPKLVMESLGKELDLDGNQVSQGLTMSGNKGSSDQHAYIQQLREGGRNFFVTFIEVLINKPLDHDWELDPDVICGDYLFGMLQGTRSSLYANDFESITVTAKEVTPRFVGALIALHERAAGIYASLININAYHQPGIEVLDLQKMVLAVLNDACCIEPDKKLTLEEIADRCNAPEQIELIYKIILHLHANDRIYPEGSWDLPQNINAHAILCKRINHTKG